MIAVLDSHLILEAVIQVNLAPPEALQRVAALAEGPAASVVLSERGDSGSLPRHPGFRLLAAMNPAIGELVTAQCYILEP